MLLGSRRAGNESGCREPPVGEQAPRAPLLGMTAPAAGRPRALTMCKRTLVAVLAVTLAVAAAQDPAAPAEDEVFCSRTQIQETSVRQQLLDTGQVMVSTHVLTSLRVGETVCISASLPDPRTLQPADRPPGEADPPDGHSSDPNETRLVNIIHEPQDSAPYNVSDEGVSPSAENASDAEEVDLRAEEEPSTPGTVASGAAEGDAPPSGAGRRRGERAARLPAGGPAALPADVSSLRRLLLPAALSRRPEPAPADGPRLRIQLTLDSVLHQHAITAAYNFSEPELGVTCTCACASFHTCSACGPLCVSKASASAAADCQGSFLGSAHTCCQLRLRPGQPFSAVRLGAAVTLLRLRVAVTELGGGRPPVTERQTVEARLGDDLRLELNATRLRLGAADQGGTTVGRGWYVLHAGELYQPQLINQLNEYNLGKLGWLKRSGDQHLMPSAARLAAAVDVLTESCTEQKFQVRGDVLLDRTLPQLGAPLPDLRPAEHTATHLRLLPAAPGRPVWLGLHLQHLQRLQYLVHRARLADFDGTLHVDARSAVLAELRLWNGSGVQHGTLRVSYGTAGPPPALYRFSLVAERRLRLRLPVALGAEQRTARLCLRPEASLAPPLCRELPVLRQPPERLLADSAPDRRLTVDGQSNPTNSMERFLRALNPATWLKSGGSWTTAVGAIIDVVLVVIAISLLWKCFSCCRSCCCRRKKT